MRIPIISQMQDAYQNRQIRIAAETEMYKQRASAYSEMRAQASKATKALMAQIEKPVMTLNDELYSSGTGYGDNTWMYDHATTRRIARIAHSQSPPAQAMLGRFVQLVHGPKLELQSAPFFDLINDSNPKNKAPENVEEQQKVIKNIEQRYKLWAKSLNSDYTGNMNHHKRSRHNFEKLLLDGEYFIILRYNQSKKRNPLNIQYIKPENVQRVSSQVLPGNYEECGIEYNKQDKAVAYHILNSKTGNSVRIPRYGTRSGRTLVIHNKINGEKRGVSIFAGIISELTKISDFHALEIQAAVVNALFAVWVETPIGGDNKDIVKKEGITGIDTNYLTRSSQNDISIADYEAKMNSTDFKHGGTIVQGMGEGQKLHSFDTKRPTANFENFFKVTLRNLFSAKGMSYDVAMFDPSASYSAIRANLLQLWNNILTLRFDHSTDYESVIFSMWMWGEIDNGNIPDYGYSDEFIRDCMSYALFTGPARPDIDPQRSAAAHKIEREQGWKTGSMIAAERSGADFDDNVQRLTVENKALTEANKPLVELDKTTFSNSETKTESKSVSVNEGA